MSVPISPSPTSPPFWLSITSTDSSLPSTFRLTSHG
ncbi:hypothetical protein LINPERPRIM_LOCUS15287 [Linum perenne]